MRKATFQNHQQVVAQFLFQAQHTIDIAMCWFSNPALFSILLKKIKSGVQIRLILQFDQANFHAKALDFRQMINKGGTIKVYQPNKLLHHKFAIVDGKNILTGSYNWTKTKHADNILILEDEHLAKAYLNEFEKLWAYTEPLSLNANNTAPPPSFHQLFQPIVWDHFDLRHAIIHGAKVWLYLFNESEMEIWNECLRMQRHFLKCKANFFEQNRGIWEALSFSHWLNQQNTNTRRLLKNYCIKMRQNDVLISATSAGKLLGAGLIGSLPQATHLETHCFGRYVQWFEFSESIEQIDNLPKRQFGLFRESGLKIVSYLEKKSMA